MARLWSSGQELNSATNGVENTFNFTPNIQTSIVRGGLYAANPTPSGTAYNFVYDPYGSNTQGDLYVRSYFRITTAPSTQSVVVSIAGSAFLVSIRCNTDRTLELWNEEDAAQIGSDSSALSLNTWYRIELRLDTTTLASSVVDALIDGVSFASSSSQNLATGSSRVRFGDSGAKTYSFSYDDIAINNTSGSFQNSYPGQGKIIHLRPNAAGDNTGWTGAYTDVDEVTPDDTTTKLSSNTLDQIEDMNIDSPTMMGDQDTVNVVAVGVRFNGVGASLNASFVLRIKASASGTVEESSAITPSNTTYVTNAAAAPRNYSLVLYDLPGASTTAWTKNDLEQAQIGVRLSATSTNAAQVSTLWASVDYTPVTVKKWGVKPR